MMRFSGLTARASKAVAPSRFDAVFAELRSIVGPKSLLTSKRDLLVYAYDAEEHRDPPDAVVFVTSTEQLREVVAVATRHNLPIVARGAGTNLSGGTLVLCGGIVVEISQMKGILDIDFHNRHALVEPGVVNLDLQNELAPLGYIFAPDPASQKVSTIGGNIGENAGGPHCFKYGVMTNHVSGLEVVLAGGEVVELGGALEDLPGFDLTGAFLGSEGTLGIATKSTLKLIHQPESVKMLLAIFDSIEDAGRAVAEIVADGMIPATLELMDGEVVRAVESKRSFGFPLDSEAVLLIEVDGLADELGRQVEEIIVHCRRSGAREVKVARDNAERDKLWAGRRSAFGAIAGITPAYIVQDGTVPRTMLPKMLRRVVEICREQGVRVANVAHAGDGNLHPIFMFDNSIPGEAERVKLVAAMILAECVAVGGTLTGEHGIGTAKQRSMPIQFGEAELRLFGQMKRVFDPSGLMNPGKIFPSVVPPLNEQARGVPDEEGFLGALSALPGGRVTLEAEELTRFATETLAPLASFRPDSVDAAKLAIDLCFSKKVAFVPIGRGARLDWGYSRPMRALVLDLSSLDGMTELDSGNQTITVGAGMTFARLAQTLGGTGLVFPLMPDSPESVTIGGLIAQALAGPGRLGYGLARDLILGLKAILPNGDLVELGGNTMKDVAGYDARKLFFGSEGTLGVIVEATLRLYPVPESKSALFARFADPTHAQRLVSCVLDSALMPTAIEMISASLWEGDSALDSREVVLLFGLEGRREAVERLERDLQNLARSLGALGVRIAPGDEASAIWRKRAMLAASAPVFARASLPIARVGELFAQAPAGARLVAHAGSGVVWAILPELDESVYSSFKKAVKSLGGIATLLRGHPEMLAASGLPPFRDEFSYMEKLRRAIDPAGIANPGKSFDKRTETTGLAESLTRQNGEK